MDSFSGLLNNAALMLVLCVIYDTFKVYAISRKALRDIITGGLVGIIAIAVMLSPWSLQPGVFFDTRWVLLSLCGLFFGLTPTAVAVFIAGSFRLYQGGAGGIVGTLVIITTAMTGLGWRYVRIRYAKPLSWKHLYAFGFLVQLVMLSCMYFMPAEMRIPIIKAVAPPILIIYPVLTMVIGLILKRQEERRVTDQALIKEVNIRKEAEKVVRKSQELWENTFDSISDIVSLQDTQLRIVKINQAGCDHVGRVPDEIIGRHCYEMFRNFTEPCPGCPLTRTIDTLKPHVREMVNEKFHKTFLVSSSPVLDEKGVLTHITHVAKDVTEKKKLEEELFQAQKMESIGTLAGGIAHDFNNILASIMGYAELVQDDIPADSNARRGINQILKSSKRAADLVRHILAFSRKSDHSLEPVSMELMVKETLKMLRASMPSSIEIKEEIEPDCGKVLADPTNIQQIVINLCTNALHAMENEKGILSILLYRATMPQDDLSEEKGESAGQFIVLEVKDTGHGMTQETQASIFEPYFTTKEVGKGTGLGLSVVHGIVKDYQGFIRVKSEVAKGSGFQIFLPALSEDETPLKLMKSHEIHQVKGTEQLLIVDDEIQILDVCRDFFSRLGYKVTITTQSHYALEKVQEDPDRFDLVISDQTMPDLTGRDLAREILKIRPDMPIIMCTGYSSVISEEDSLNIGIRKYVKKPVSMQTLAASVRQLLDEV